MKQGVEEVAYRDEDRDIQREDARILGERGEALNAGQGRDKRMRMQGDR